MIDEVTINERFAKIRNDLRLSQSDFAQGIGIRQASVSDIERGKIELNNKIIIALNTKFNISFNWLFYGIGDMYQKKNPILFTEKEGNPLIIRTIEDGEPVYMYTEKETNPLYTQEREIANKKLIAKLITANKLQDSQHSFAEIAGNILMISEYLDHYEMYPKMKDTLNQYQDKKITLNELTHKFKEYVISFKELFHTIEPYKNVIEEIYQVVSKFDNKHDCMYLCEESND